MNRARRRAQAAALHPAAGRHGTAPAAEDYAEAVSDIWEALLRESLDIIHQLVEDRGVVTAETGLRILNIEENLK